MKKIGTLGAMASTNNATRPCILIAMPSLMDPYFNHTTSLLCEFTEEGAMGLVLNRPIALRLEDILDPSLKISMKQSPRIYWGGPVQNETGWILHEDSNLANGSLQIGENLFLSSSVEVLRSFLGKEPSEVQGRYRFFLGYAGWSAHQLEEEMAQASWVTGPVDKAIVFDSDSQSLWLRSLQGLGINPMFLSGTPQGEAN